MPHPRPLAEKRLLMFVDDIYEDLELWYPKLRMIEAGATTVRYEPCDGPNYVGTRSGTVYMPVGPNGVINPRNGSFIPVQ